MKQLLLIMGLACLGPNIANAQDKAAPQAPSAALHEFLRGRTSNDTRPEGVRMFVSPTSEKRQTISVGVVRRDSGAVLRALAAILGVRIVIDSEIEFAPAQTRGFSFNYVDEDVFAQLTEPLIREGNIEMWKSPEGTYFFAAKPKVAANPKLGELGVTQDGLWSRHPDPFIANLGQWKTVEPQPGWEKREFNGHEFYYVPAPTAKPQADQK